MYLQILPLYFPKVRQPISTHLDDRRSMVMLRKFSWRQPILRQPTINCKLRSSNRKPIPATSPAPKNIRTALQIRLKILHKFELGYAHFSKGALRLKGLQQ